MSSAYARGQGRCVRQSAALLGLTAALGCIPADDADGASTVARQLVPCDSLAFGPAPVQIGTVQLVGDAPGGVRYVLSQRVSGGLQDRVFSAQGELLVRRHVTASGLQHDSEQSSRFNPSPFAVWVEFEAGGRRARVIYRVEDSRVRKAALVYDQARSSRPSTQSSPPVRA